MNVWVLWEKRNNLWWNWTLNTSSILTLFGYNSKNPWSNTLNEDGPNKFNVIFDFESNSIVNRHHDGIEIELKLGQIYKNFKFMLQ